MKMNFNKKIYIKDKLISSISPTFVIAEAGVNHKGNMKIAKQLIDLAVTAKADAVKFQTFKAEHLILNGVKKAAYQQKTSDPIESQYDMLKSLEVSQDQNMELKKYCEDKSIIFLTTPFDEKSLDDLDLLNLPAYKIASTDTTNLLFLKKVAKKGRPIILSTGMCYFSEVKLAMETIYKYNKDVILLQCSANYPIQDIEANLGVINTYKDNFDALFGYSDHTVGIGAAPFAIPMGAKVVEKHFTIDKSDEGPDHAASLSPDELIEFVKTVRKVDTFMGSNIKEPTMSEHGTRKSLQKCLVASQKIKLGDIFSDKNVVAKRTGGIGISAIQVDMLLGHSSDKDYNKDQIIDPI